MKTIMIGLSCCLLQLYATAQADKRPVIVEQNITNKQQTIDLFANYADQGKAMYFNNSLFYNKDNKLLNNAPVSNGRYERPGYNNDVNRNNLNTLPPSGIIYSGVIPIRTFGKTESENR